MDRNRAKIIFLTGQTAAKRGLSAAAKCAAIPNIREQILMESRDVLDACCRLFEDGDACEIHDDVYLPLFDTLALDNDAIVRRETAREHITAAMCVIDSQPVMGGAS